MQKVSVIIPAYNKSELTLRAIESVLNQTYDNIEIIVVDDGSSDNTKEELKSFGNKIRYIFKENAGACSARNVGIKQATGEYIALLDCDDIYYPEKLAKSVEYLETNPDYGFVSTNAYLIDANDKVVSVFSNSHRKRNGFIASKLIFINLVCNSTVIVRRSCFKKVGYYDEKIFIPADWDMWLRLAEVYKAGYIDEKLTGYRVSDSYTKSHKETALNENLYVIKKTFNRNNVISKKLINKGYANIYFGFGIAHIADSNIHRARELFFKAAKNRPANPKMLIVLALSLLFPRGLVKIIKIKYNLKKINQEKNS